MPKGCTRGAVALGSGLGARWEFVHQFLMSRSLYDVWIETKKKREGGILRCSVFRKLFGKGKFSPLVVFI